MLLLKPRQKTSFTRMAPVRLHLKHASSDLLSPHRDFFSDETLIYLQEYTSPSERNHRYRMARVHVFRGWRIRRNVEDSAPLPLKFQNMTVRRGFLFCFCF